MRVRFAIPDTEAPAQNQASTEPNAEQRHAGVEIPDLSWSTAMLLERDGMHYYVEWEDVDICVEEKGDTVEESRPCWSCVEDFGGPSYQDLPVHKDEEDPEYCDVIYDFLVERSPSPTFQCSSPVSSSTESSSFWETRSEGGTDTDATSVGCGPDDMDCEL